LLFAILIGGMDEGRKRVLLIAASILAARKLSHYDGGKRGRQPWLRFQMLCAGRKKSCVKLTGVGRYQKEVKHCNDYQYECKPECREKRSRAPCAYRSTQSWRADS